MTKLTAEKCRAQFEEWLCNEYVWAEEAIMSSFFKGDDKTGRYYGCSYEYDGHSCAESLHWAWRGWQAREALDTDLPAQIENDGWIGWGGGEIPVERMKTVEVKFRDGATDTDKVYEWYWQHTGKVSDIIAYRVIEREGGRS